MKKITRALSFILCSVILLCLTVTFSSANSASYQYGDADNNGQITAADARIILRVSVGMEMITAPLTYYDTDNDGRITSADARLALRMATGLYTHERSITVPDGAEIIGYSSENYPIYKIDGCFYVDGILLVNKTYSVPYNYAPGDLTQECKAAFERMRKDAAAQGLNLYINSAYRSYSYQQSLYNRYVSRDGKRVADTYSARPGHSEHQTGLALDLNTVTQSFANTKEGKWVAEHCHEYGFIIRYPKGKTHLTGYYYEPWHLRYVGADKATQITNSGKCLEEYYGISSVYS